MVKSEYLVCGYLGNFSNELGFFSPGRDIQYWECS